MFSSNVKQFSIKHLLVSFVLFGIGMGLVATGESLPVQWGILLLVALVGVFFAYFAMLISDIIDVRRVDDRRFSSRFINGLGLWILGGTLLVSLVFGAVVLFQSLIWVLDKALLA